MQTIRSAPPARVRSGFTLVEMLVVLTLLAVVIGLGIPGLRDLVIRTSVNAAADAFVEALNVARLEALTRNAQVTVCKTANPDETNPTCASSTADWPEGWVVFVDHGVIGSLEPSDKVISAGRANGRIDSALEMPARAAAITFNPVGPITGPAGSMQFRWGSALSGRTFERVICLSYLGRASLLKSGECEA